MAGIYLHIPFCKQACYYCDFHFSTNTSLRSDLVKALASELQLQKNYLDEPVKTIYFGGGTPSLLDDAEISFLLKEIEKNFEVAGSAEITLEANPDDLTPEKLNSLYELGINRLSIGIQSFDDTVLRFLNRVHDSEAGYKCIADARASGFTNISIDLIYAIPSQNKHSWINNILKGTELEPEHISAYSLTIEEKTVFGRWAAKGKLIPAGEEASAEQLDVLLQILEKAGYEHYEISNFAKPSYYSRHNSSYWKQEPYLGIGPSAHSYNISSRQHNISNNHEYMRSIKMNQVPCTVEFLSIQEKINDYLLTTLRTCWGSDLFKLKKEFNYDLVNIQSGYIERLVSNKLAKIEKDHLILTRTGKFLADKISADLFYLQ
jgi:oxygen-independent coproporphyrinogen III oxidase